MSNMKIFRFRVSTNLLFGVGQSEKLGQEVEDLGYCKVAAIIDNAVFEHPQVAKAIESVKRLGISLDICKNTAVEPTYDYLESFKQQLKKRNYDCLVGIGGGSALDLTKGIAVLLTNEGEAISFRGFPKLKNRPVPVIAIPTTAGTGSELTYNAVFNDSREKRKLGINSILNFPVCAIIDPLLMVNSPRSVTVSSGVDAIVHAIESFAHKDNTPISRIYSKKAFELLFNGLMKVLDLPLLAGIRADLSLGAYLAATALINAGSGPAGAFSYPLGVVYNISHGYAGGMFLCSIIETNIKKGYQEYAELYDLIGGVDKTLSVKEKNIGFLGLMNTLMDKLEVPRKLSYYNLGLKDIQFIIDQYDKLKAGIDQNPVEITKEDVEKIMRGLA